MNNHLFVNQTGNISRKKTGINIMHFVFIIIYLIIYVEVTSIIILTGIVWPAERLVI
jgi:hypothetical protein